MNCSLGTAGNVNETMPRIHTRLPGWNKSKIDSSHLVSYKATYILTCNMCKSLKMNFSYDSKIGTVKLKQSNGVIAHYPISNFYFLGLSIKHVTKVHKE